MRKAKQARVIIKGQPVMKLWFEGLPSVNRHYGLHFRPRSVQTAEWRYEAKTKAISYMLRRSLIAEDTLIPGRAFVLVNVYPPFEEVSDIHNVYTKALLDGFSDAGVWPDDEWAHVPLFAYRWAGVGTNVPNRFKGRHTRLDVYPLGALIINGEYQRLPKGRVRL